MAAEGASGGASDSIGDDAVSFVPPLGDFRPWSRCLFVTLPAVAALIVVPHAVRVDSEVEFVLDGLVWVLGAVAAFVVLHHVVAATNAWIAGGLLRKPPTLTSLEQLAARCWLVSLSRMDRRETFDVAGWIKATGPDGPRVVLSDLRLPAIAMDPLAAEEEPIDDQVVSKPGSRVASMFGVVLSGIAIVWGFAGVRGWGRSPVFTAAMASIVILVLHSHLRRLGVNIVPLGSCLASPGRVSCLELNQRGVFTRADSVMWVRPMGTWPGLEVRFLRADGRSVRLRFIEGASSPQFAKLISRWCRRPPDVRR